MGDRGGQRVQSRYARDVGKLRAGSVQCFLGDLAFRHVLKSADEQGATRSLYHHTSHAAYVFHPASGKQNPEYEVDVSTSHSARDQSFKRRQILWVDHVPNHLHRDLGRGIELEDAEGLLGPVVVVCQQICDEAARFAQPLGFGETKIGLLDLRLRPLPVVDVCKEEIPAGYRAFRISHWDAAHLEPSENAVRAAATVLNLVNLPCFDRLFARLDYTWEVIGVNDIDQGPILQLFTRFAEVLKGLSVEKLDLAHCARRSHKPGDAVDDLPPGEFSLAHRILSPLAILNVYTGSVPFEDVARSLP